MYLRRNEILFCGQSKFIAHEIFRFLNGYMVVTINGHYTVFKYILTGRDPRIPNFISAQNIRIKHILAVISSPEEIHLEICQNNPQSPS
jgi:hypothetical protein